MEKIVVVDENDNELGERGKEECHDGEGILHRAFLAMVFDDDGRLLLARRSNDKRLWPGYWDGTVASHPYMGEGFEQASQRRLVDEIGLSTDDIEYLFKFQYKARYRDKGAEHEICAVTAVRGMDLERISPVAGEISETKLVDLKTLADDIRKNGSSYTPWLIIALKKMMNN